MKRSTASAASTATSCQRIVHHLEAAIPLRHARRSRAALARARPVVSHRRGRRPHGLRRGLGAGHRLAGRHDERLHRGLHGRPRHQGRVGRHRLLHQPREDGAHPRAGRERPVVRGPHADRPGLPQAGRAGRDGHGHRGGGGGGRCRSDHADRREPAQRPARARGARQQVGHALERDRGLREQHHRRVPPRVRLERRRVRARQALGRDGRRAGHRDPRGAGPRLGPHGGAASPPSRRSC